MHTDEKVLRPHVDVDLPVLSRWSLLHKAVDVDFELLG